MKIYLPLLLALATSLSAVPSDINYQGRLTDANGDAVTGDVTMSVKMYDAQSGGNEIYSEDIGTVTLDENGVYSFQFGASGNSTVTKTETIVTSDGSSTEYTGTFTSTPIDGTISVTDETYSWNDIDGNPGEQATAYIVIINGFVIFADIENGGSGYDDNNPPLVTITGDGAGATATATVENGVVTGIALPNAGNNYTEGEIIIAPPPAPFTVDKVDGNLEVGYASSPTNGTGVVATYKTLEPTIIGALSEASSHWLELTVDGAAQSPRERILSVPFAQVAGNVEDFLTKKIKNKIISQMSGFRVGGDTEDNFFLLPLNAHNWNGATLFYQFDLDEGDILKSVTISGKQIRVRIFKISIVNGLTIREEIERIQFVTSFSNANNLVTHSIDLNIVQGRNEFYEAEIYIPRGSESSYDTMLSSFSFEYITN